MFDEKFFHDLGELGNSASEWDVVPTPSELFEAVWICSWCAYENPELEIRCRGCGRKDD